MSIDPDRAIAMPSCQNATLDSVVVDGYRRGIPSTAQEDPFAAPFAEGGKARDIVHLCASLGLAAVFIDQRGRAFHASAEAKRFFGAEGKLDLASGKLVGRPAASTARIEDVVSQALCAVGPSADRRPFKVGTVDPVHLTVVDYPNPSAYQLLKAVVVLERRSGEREAEIRSLVRLLDEG